MLSRTSIQKNFGYHKKELGHVDLANVPKLTRLIQGRLETSVPLRVIDSDEQGGIQTAFWGTAW